MEPIWLQSYPQNVPHTINVDQLSSSTADFFRENCKRFAERPALKNNGVVISYENFLALAERFAAFLQNTWQLKKGERIAFMLPNLLQYPIALFGAHLAGLIVVNVNPQYTSIELTHQLKDAKPSAIVLLNTCAHVLEETLQSIRIPHILITQVGDAFPWFQRTYTNFYLNYIKKIAKPYNIPNTNTWHDAMHTQKNESYTPVLLTHTDIAFLQYTGGTTGLSKGAVLTHGNILANIEQGCLWALQDSGSNEVFIAALPLYHIFSLMENCLNAVRIGGLNVLVTNPRNVEQLVNILRDSQFTILTGVNTLFNALLQNPTFATLDFSRVRLVVGGGMPVYQATAEQWQKITGKFIIEAYGLTEASPGACSNPNYITSYNGSIGLPIPSTEVSFRDDNEQEVDLNTPGELCIRGPQVMAGYWKQPEETAKVFTKDGFVKTGDIATIDAKGFIRIVDRKKDMILVSGFNVYPNEIEEVLMKHPGIKEAAVIGAPNAVSGEVIKAFVVKKDPTLTAEDVRAFAHTQLTGYKVPREIVFRDSLPKSTVGKILRRALKDQAVANG